MLARHQGAVTTHGVGLVASIATVILMAGNKVAVDDNCFLLVHLPWTVAQGNSEDLQKEIEALDKCKTAMMGYYRRHCKIPEERLEQYIKDETWFLGTEFAEVFDVEVLPCDKQLDIAAKIDLKKFKTLPKGLIMENKTEDKPVEDKLVITVAEEPDEEKTETGPETEEPEDPDTKEETEDPDTKEEPEDPEEEKVTKAEVEKRVSGMQAKMQGKINDLKADFDARIKEFQNQLKAKDEELQSYKNECISLNSKLETAEKELSEKTSALEAKENALAQLNADVNLPPAEDSLPTFDEGVKACKTPREVVAFIKSGKFKTK